MSVGKYDGWNILFIGKLIPLLDWTVLSHALGVHKVWDTLVCAADHIISTYNSNDSVLVLSIPDIVVIWIYITVLE